MISEFVDSIFIGCATDRAFVGPTCAMLSSLDDNGNVPEATVIVADFGLARQDRAIIRKSAGGLGQAMRFLPLDRSSPLIVALPRFDFPLPLLGRLVIPGEIRTPRARLVLLDSDMIVNRTIRPLFEMSMRGRALGAVHDAIAVREHYGRDPDHDYFNAGMMMIDIDRFNADGIAAKAMRRLAAYDERPKWLDQDALNAVIGDRWLSLDRRWNYFHAADRRAFDMRDYEAANIIHFAGDKPWHGHAHPAASVYYHHKARAEQKTVRQPVKDKGTNRVFAAACHEVLLGRELEQWVFRQHADLPPARFVAEIVASAEFRAAVIEPLAQGLPLSADRFPGRPSISQLYWAIDRLPMLDDTATGLEEAVSWRDLLGPLVEDRHFMTLAGLDPVAVIDAPQRA